ncbi:Ku protein [Pelotomaculum propionicicum]|uniref:non-homologous end joining protein Ku n=1 Tax=Pelotomaculum propionicicum TaxID=258475 RepID=UPI003B77BC52
MRSMWKGAISFGLVYVPVKLYAATEHKDIKFNYLHKKCKNPVQYRKYCPYCQTEVSMDDIVRGYEYEKGKYVILEDEDFAQDTANGPGKNIEILDFVDLSEIDPVYYEKSYYLAPGDGGAKVYELLKRAMDETGKVAVARVMIRSRESLAAIRVSGGTIVMSTMHYPDEIRQPGALTELNYQVSLHDNEVKMAVSLINSLSAEFQPEKYTDKYRQGLMERIQAKIAGEAVEMPARQETGKVVDLMEALKASINLAKEERDQKKATRENKSTADTGAEKLTAAKTRARRKTS